MKPNNISYKDTSARVMLEDGIYYRYIYYQYKNEYDYLIQSGLYKVLSEKGLMISHQEEKQNHTDYYKKLKPQQIYFQSYPFEWSYRQWRKVIYTYLQINKIALGHGMILKDATPYNFYFEGGEAILLDTSSFQFYNEGDQWMAYRQFCSEMLSPFALMHFNGQIWARITQSHLRGMPLNFVSKQLSLKSWLNMTCLLHIHLHGKFANRDNGNNSLRKTNTKNVANHKGFSIEKILLLMKMLQSTVLGWKRPYSFERHWIDYYKVDIVSDKYLTHKVSVIRDWLSQLSKQEKISSILDLGANTGKFSIIASEYVEKVIALEYDDICVDAIDKAISSSIKKNIYCVRMDLVEATPNMGVLEKEFSSIYTRAKSCMVLGLALIHHLFITSQLNFDQIAFMFYEFTTKNVIIEFIPVTDSKVQFLIKDKKRGYSDYNEDGFKNALQKYFQIIERKKLEESERILYFLEKI
jgi:hypothetical protein